MTFFSTLQRDGVVRLSFSKNHRNEEEEISNHSGHFLRPFPPAIGYRLRLFADPKRYSLGLLRGTLRIRAIILAPEEVASVPS